MSDQGATDRLIATMIGAGYPMDVAARAARVSTWYVVQCMASTPAVLMMMKHECVRCGVDDEVDEALANDIDV